MYKSGLLAAVMGLASCNAALADTPAAAPAAGGNALSAFFPLIIFVVIFYFFILRLQKKRQKTHENLVSSLARGDKIITAGGFFGIVREVKDDSVIIEIAEGIKARILKGSISTKVTAAEAPAAPAEPAPAAEAPAEAAPAEKEEQK